ncbi:MAG: TolC family protein [Bacteroidales bacterium]|nr:TolC family protein [Bacteroidales bacterium]
MNKKHIIIMLAAILPVVASCGITKKYQRDENVRSEGLYSFLEDNSQSLGSLKVSEVFTDPHLLALIDTLLLNNSDIQIAELAMEQAKVGYSIGKANLAPTLSFDPSVGYNTSTNFSYQVPVSLQWQLTFFGKLNTMRQAGASYRMSQDQQQAVTSQMVATMAANYYELVSLDAALALADEAIRRWDELVKTMTSMKDAGLGNAVSIEQTKGQRADIAATREEVIGKIYAMEANICALMRTPHHRIKRGTMAEQNFPEILSTGVSMEILDRRPDVRVSERNLEYYYYGQNIARSKFFPTLTLSATGLFNGQFIGDFIAGLSQPIFAGYKVAGNYKIAKADYEKAKIEYEQSLINAGREVFTYLGACNTCLAKKEHRVVQIESLLKAVKYSRSLMMNGSATYLEVLYANQDLLGAQNSVISDWLEFSQNLVSLYLALGGGAEIR